MDTTDRAGAMPRPALVATAFRELPLGAVAPAGWLREQLRLQADGLTGHLDELWPDVGPNSAWLGGDGEDWERGPYYLDGLVPLAYLLGDDRLIAKARRWVEAALAGQRPDGQFGPASNDDWWPRMVMLKALAQYHDATGDPRIIPFMDRYLRYQAAHLGERPLKEWAVARGADNVLVVYWLYEQTGDPSLLHLADLILAQTTDWGTYLTSSLPTARVAAFDHLTHSVNVAMGLKEPAMRYRRDGSPDHLAAIDAAIVNLNRYHGQVMGTFSGDEWLAGLDPAQGVELCTVVEYMYSLEQLVRVYGDGRFADRLELLAYNALAATITADLRAHQYHQQPNQALATVAPRPWTIGDQTCNTFGLEPHFGCCTANMHQGWPKLARSLWMSYHDGAGREEGLAAIVYAPCVVRAVVDNIPIAIEEDTGYPFDETVRFTVRTARPATFGLRLRVPGWCAGAHLSVNGRDEDVPSPHGGFVTLRRAWCEGDVVELALPMAVRAIPRPRGAVGVARGPLVFALEIGEEWARLPATAGFGDWEARPTTPWNYALALDPADPGAALAVEQGTVGTPPFGHAQAPVRLRARGYRVPDWGLADNSAGPPPASPLRTEGVAEPIALIPYGAARLRIAEFPVASV